MIYDLLAIPAAHLSPINTSRTYKATAGKILDQQRSQFFQTGKIQCKAVFNFQLNGCALVIAELASSHNSNEEIEANLCSLFWFVSYYL